MQTSTTRVVLVTGASSGIGQAIAVRLAQRGYRVFGTSRRPAEPLVDGVEMLALDVTSDESAQACVDAVMARAGRLDGLVNNAGTDLIGAVEEVSLDEAHLLFETNFFGMVRMIRAALPIMRAQGGGHIVNLSSGMAFGAMPFETFYTASKYAVEGMSASLRHEVRPFGIHVSVVEPGFYRSNIRDVSHRVANPLPVYDAARTRVDHAFNVMVERGGDPREVAAVVERILAQPAPGLRYPVSLEALGAALMRRVIPNPVVEKGTRLLFGLDDWRDDVHRYGPAIGLALGALVMFGALSRPRRR